MADLILLLEIAMALGLLAGAWLARTRRFGSHPWCQSVIVLPSTAVVARMMIPSFRVHVLPRIPGRLGKAYWPQPTQGSEPSPDSPHYTFFLPARKF